MHSSVFSFAAQRLCGFVIFVMPVMPVSVPVCGIVRQRAGGNGPAADEKVLPTLPRKAAWINRDFQMAASAALAILALCNQKNYVVQGKEDWQEPLNLYILAVASPSERKSAVLKLLAAPVEEHDGHDKMTKQSQC